MATWCLTVFDGSMAMRELTGGSRAWTLSGRLVKDQPPMRITESVDCLGDSEEDIRLIQNVQQKTASGATYNHVVYSLNKNGCTLAFDLPIGPGLAGYRQYMLYGILVGYEKKTQLYEILQ